MFMRTFAGYLPVSQFMSDRECRRQTCVFINVAATVWLAHARHMGKTKGFTWAIHGGTDISSVVTQNTTISTGILGIVDTKNVCTGV